MDILRQKSNDINWNILCKITWTYENHWKKPLKIKCFFCDFLDSVNLETGKSLRCPTSIFTRLCRSKASRYCCLVSCHESRFTSCTSFSHGHNLLPSGWWFVPVETYSFCWSDDRQTTNLISAHCWKYCWTWWRWCRITLRFLISAYSSSSIKSCLAGRHL